MKRLIKGRVSFIFMLLVVISFVAACGGSGGGENVNNETPDPTPIPSSSIEVTGSGMRYVCNITTSSSSMAEVTNCALRSGAFMDQPEQLDNFKSVCTSASGTYSEGLDAVCPTGSALACVYLISGLDPDTTEGYDYLQIEYMYGLDATMLAMIDCPQSPTGDTNVEVGDCRASGNTESISGLCALPN